MVILEGFFVICEEVVMWYYGSKVSSGVWLSWIFGEFSGLAILDSQIIPSPPKNLIDRTYTFSAHPTNICITAL